jgi:alanine--tRNA ligase
MEFFSRGIELFNQVYMMFEQTEDGRKPLDIKVLDMGLGMERIAWFSQGKENIYEATFPKVLKKLKSATKVKMDHNLYKKFSQYSILLNADEVENMDEAWATVGEKIGENPEKLKEKISPMTAIYSIAEHARTLLVAISDGALPSNVGGGYNLRLVFRRAMRFIDKFGWDIDMGDVAKWHAEELKDIFPELLKHAENVKRILDNEKEKYYEMKERSKNIVANIIKKNITTDTLIKLYDSNGINPEIVKEEAKALGKEIIVPDNFYALVAERHENLEQLTATKKETTIDIGTVPETKALYFDDWKPKEFTAKILKIIDDYVILDRTQFYPTSGGQINDTGYINGDEVLDVFKQGKVIIHKLKNISFKVGDIVKCHVDEDRRKQLAEHHTSTHIINAAAKKVLGDHINQAGARKTLEKATLDLTHYKNISDEEIKEIEDESNKIVKEAHTIKKSFMKREAAEKKYGMRIYQGGAVPGKELRIVDIDKLDVEACGGTHLNNTSEAGNIHILKSTKIQDGIVRITFTAGERAGEEIGKKDSLADDLAAFFGVEKELVPARAEELFSKWKKAKKAVKKGKEINLKELELTSKEKFDGNILEETAKRLKTQIEHLPSTLNRFKKELEEAKEKLS